jgi:hypothetical protein
MERDAAQDQVRDLVGEWEILGWGYFEDGRWQLPLGRFDHPRCRIYSNEPGLGPTGGGGAQEATGGATNVEDALRTWKAGGDRVEHRGVYLCDVSLSP